MTNHNNLIRRYPLLSYTLLAFALSWGSVSLVLGQVPGPMTQSQERLPLAVVAMLVGPSVAGLLLTGLVYGKDGYRRLLSRLGCWRVNRRWYAVALLTAPLSLAASLLVLALFYPGVRPGIVTAADKGSLLLFAIVGGLVTGFCEELGWTGFAVPRLRERYGLYPTGLVVGIVWGAWHFLVNLWGSGAASGSLSLPLYLAVVLFSFLPPYRLLMVWVYDRTNSLLVPVLMHACLVAFWQLAMPEGIGGAPQAIWYLAWTAVLWMGVAAVALTGAREPRASQPKELRAPRSSQA